MENKITTRELAAMLALKSGKQKELCEAFLQKLVLLLDEELSRGEGVRIKGLGSFKIVEVEARKSVNVSTGEEYEIPAHSRVSFVAGKELASLVNRPFEAFEVVELPDDMPQSMLEKLTDTQSEDFENNTEVDDQEEEPMVISIPPIEPDETKDKKTEEESIVDAGINTGLEAGAEAAFEVEEVEDEGLEDDDTEDEHRRDGKRFGFLKGFFVGFAAAVIFIGCLIGAAYYLGYFNQVSSNSAGQGKGLVAGNRIASSDETAGGGTSAPGETGIMTTDTLPLPVETNTVDNGEEAVPTQPSDSGKIKEVVPPVYDTVTTTRYLTTIAKEHYGNFNLWPIIYEENKAILGHPDRIKPGTKVVVPPLSKYNVDPNDEAQVREIKRRGVEIYARFKK